MVDYRRVMAGAKSIYVKECVAGGFIGANYQMPDDLTPYLYEDWKEFNRKMIPVYLKHHPGQSKVAAGSACGALWTVAKGLKIGDIVLTPDGAGHYHVGEVAGEYIHHPGEILPHRRAITWREQTILRADMSAGLQGSTGAANTVVLLNDHAEEILRLMAGGSGPNTDLDAAVSEDLGAFAMEKHLEDFLIQNWSHTALGTHYEIFTDGDETGQQFPTDTGPIDILAISKDKKTLLVVELKKGRPSDAVVGQILRYMGYVSEELAEPTQTVKGVVIALEDDKRIRRALAMVPDVKFYRYQISFKLVES